MSEFWRRGFVGVVGDGTTVRMGGRDDATPLRDPLSLSLSLSHTLT